MEAPGRPTPWTVLGLPPGECDAKAVRRAYAARLREHPPETDPEGFRAVRDAYEQLLHTPRAALLHLAREAGEAHDVVPGAPGRGASEDDEALDGPAGSASPRDTLHASPHGNLDDVAPRDAPPPAPLPPPPPPPSVPPAWRDALVQALARHTEQRRRAGPITDALAGLLEQAEAHPMGLSLLLELLEEARPTSDRLALARAFPTRVFVALLHQDAPRIPQWIRMRLMEGVRVQALAELAVGLAATADRLPSDHARREACIIAIAVAPLVPNAARMIVDQVWAAAAPAERRRLPVRLADERIAVGEEAALWERRDMTVRIARALLGADMDAPLGEAEAATLVDFLERQDLSDALWGMVRAALPAPGEAPAATPPPHEDVQDARPAPRSAASHSLASAGAAPARFPLSVHWSHVLIALAILGFLSRTLLTRDSVGSPRPRRSSTSPSWPGRTEPQLRALGREDALEIALRWPDLIYGASLARRHAALEEASRTGRLDAQDLAELEGLRKLKASSQLRRTFTEAELRRLQVLRARVKRGTPLEPDHLREFTELVARAGHALDTR